jgi:hypothetical protein
LAKAFFLLSGPEPSPRPRLCAPQAATAREGEDQVEHVYRTTRGGAGQVHDLAVADRGVRTAAGMLPRVMSIVLCGISRGLRCCTLLLYNRSQLFELSF